MQFHVQHRDLNQRRSISTYTGQADGKTLELTARQLRHFTLVDVTQLKFIQNLIQVVELLLLVEKGADGLLGALERSGKLVDVLGLDNRCEVIL